LAAQSRAAVLGHSNCRYCRFGFYNRLVDKKNVSLENANKKWFKWFTDGTGWESVIKASRFMLEIEAFKKG
jgi:hypothetical protein